MSLVVDCDSHVMEPADLWLNYLEPEYRDRAIDQFEQLYLDAKESARVMALVFHPYLMGVPHRFRYFREALEHISGRPDVLFWTGEQILDWYRGAVGTQGQTNLSQGAASSPRG